MVVVDADAQGKLQASVAHVRQRLQPAGEIFDLEAGVDERSQRGIRIEVRGRYTRHQASLWRWSCQGAGSPCGLAFSRIR